MRVLLCTLTVGEGLNRICQAVSESLNKLGVENEIFNVYENNPKQAYYNSTFYYKLVKKIPRTVKFFQRKLGHYNRSLKNKDKITFIKKDVKETTKPLLDKLAEKDFDIIFTPVSHIAVTALRLRQNNLTNCKIVYCYPDFNIPTYSELCRNIEAVITPCQEIDNNLLKYGFDKDKVHQLKFPICERFLVKKDKEQIKEQLGINKDKFTVLLMSGGYGFAKNSKIVKKLIDKTQDIHYIVVNGKNKVEFDKINELIKERNLTNVTNIGYANNVDELMTASDLVYTKTGSATIVESFAKNIPIITTKQLLYPEYDNLLHLSKYKSAIECKNLNDLAKKIMSIKNGEIDIKEYKQNLAKLLNINSSQEIAELLVNLNK